MKRHDVVQGTPEWLALRCQFPTASEFDKLVTPAKLEVSKSIKKYVALKLAEKWTGRPQQIDDTFSMDQGKVLEQQARPWYALEFGVELDTPGFITNDAGTAGCSPDFLVRGQKRGGEIKCPEAPTHVAWFIDDVLPREHLLQVQGSLWVCDYDEWDFVSFRPGNPSFPSLVKTAKRDRNIHDALDEAIGMYWELFNKGWARLVDANGGEPVRMYRTEYGEDGSVVQTLKPEFMTNDPILEILERQ